MFTNYHDNNKINNNNNKNFFKPTYERQSYRSNVTCFYTTVHLFIFKLPYIYIKPFAHTYTSKYGLRRIWCS